MQTNQEFSHLLQRRLDELGWNLSELAKRMAVDVSSPSRWIKGTIPRRKMLLDLMSVLKLDDVTRAEWEALTEQGANRIADQPMSYLSKRGRAVERPSADDQMMLAMVTILQDVVEGVRPKEHLEQVHALLDLVHPLQHKQTDPP